MPADLVGRVEGKSSLARLGLFVHVTAGFIDPGFEGHITLELFCANGRGITLYPGMPVCQISFENMESPPMRPYGKGATGSKYMGQEQGPTPSRYYANFPLT
jgi:dCTP deaminase